ncbi:MAG: type II toxin-antitoxin system RelB/DinJ family antitoxin [Candidatus Ornithomonoglobus sp.]
MAKVSTSITIDAETKKQAQILLSDFGMDLSTAVNVFLKQMIYEGTFPFTITRDIPNSDTIAAMKEAEEMEKHPEKYKRYSSFSELLDEVSVDA